MADTQSRLAEIYKAEKSKGGGIASTLGKRALEKVDPRQFFNQKGFMAAALPSLFKTYSATPVKSGEKIASAGGGSFSSGVLETKLDMLTGETRELKIHSKLAAKNSMSLPDMARDMNVMRQNIQKLVKLQGGTAAKGADMYFKKSSENEAAYENRFIKERGVKTTPTQVGAKSEEKKGIFATIMEGLSSIFSMKGALIAGILAVLTLGIKEYFSNDEFKGKVDALVSDMFSTIKGFLIEYWKEVAIGLALLFPSATMALISSGISILSNGITLLSKAATTLVPLLADGLTFALRGLLYLLRGPGGLVIMLGLALFAARKLFDQNQEEYLKLAKEKKEKGSLSEKDEARLKQLETPVNREKARQDLKYDPTTGKAVSDEEAKKSMDQVTLDTRTSHKRIEEAAFTQLANEWEKGGKKDPLLNPNDRRNVARRTEELKAQGYVPKDMPADVKVEGSGAPSVLPNETAGGAAVGLYPTPGMQRKPGLNHGGRTTQKLVGGGVDDERLIKPDVPTPASYSNEGKTRPTTAPSSTGAYRGQRSDISSSPSQVTSTSSQVASYGGYKSRQDFTDAMMPYAQKAATELKVSPEAIIAQWGLETGFGRAGAVQGQFNYGNIQGTYRESEPGLDAGRARNFIKYKSMDDFVDDYVKQLKNPRYAKQGIGQEQLGDREFFTALKKGGYAEDPNYVNTLTALAEKQRGIKPGAPGQVPTYEKPATALAQNNPSGLKMPTLGTLAAAAPSMGDMIEAATSEFTGALRLFDSALASITNITNNNTQSSAAAQQSQGNLPSVYDDVFLNLFQRVT